MKKAIAFILSMAVMMCCTSCAAVPSLQETIICSSCMETIMVGAKFCPSCGASLNVQGREPTKLDSITQTTVPTAPTSTQINQALETATQYLNEAKSYFAEKQWGLIIQLCEKVMSLVPNTNIAEEAKSLVFVATSQQEIEVERIMEWLNEAFNNSRWEEVVTHANAIIDNYSTFNVQVQMAKQLKQSAISNLYTAALSKLTLSKDEVENITWYDPASKPQYINAYCVSYLYIGQRQSGKPWLRWRTIFVEDEWLFFDEVIFNVDGQIYGITDFERDEIFRDNNSKNIWEYFDINPGETHLDLVRAIIESKKTIIRFKSNDDNKTYDYVVTRAEKDGFADILEVYYWMCQMY